MENKEELPGPVILHTEPISCSMTVARTGDTVGPLPTSSISMQLRLVRDEVKTPDDKDLTRAQWSMTFYDGQAGIEFTEAYSAIGVLNYDAPYHSESGDLDDSPESCRAWINLDSQTFALLRDMALAGKLPTYLHIHVLGLKYGWDPDGSSKVWDVKAYPNAPIKSVEIDTCLVRPARPVQDAEEVDPVWSDPVPDSPELVALRSMTKSIEAINARLGIVIALLVVTAAAVIFR